MRGLPVTLRNDVPLRAATFRLSHPERLAILGAVPAADWPDLAEVWVEPSRDGAETHLRLRAETRLPAGAHTVWLDAVARDGASGSLDLTLDLVAWQGAETGETASTPDAVLPGLAALALGRRSTRRRGGRPT